MYVYLYMYYYYFVYINSYINNNKYIYTYIYTYLCMHACMYTYTYIHIYIGYISHLATQSPSGMLPISSPPPSTVAGEDGMGTALSPARLASHVRRVPPPGEGPARRGALAAPPPLQRALWLSEVRRAWLSRRRRRWGRCCCWACWQSRSSRCDPPLPPSPFLCQQPLLWDMWPSHALAVPACSLPTASSDTRSETYTVCPVDRPPPSLAAGGDGGGGVAPQRGAPAAGSAA